MGSDGSHWPGFWLSVKHGRLLVDEGSVYRYSPRVHLGELNGNTLTLHQSEGSGTPSLVQLQLNENLSNPRAGIVFWKAVVVTDADDTSFVGDQWDTWDRCLLLHLHVVWPQAYQLFPRELQEDRDPFRFFDMKEELPHKVALVTTSHNRLWQLQVALPLNLLFAWPHRQSITIYVLDYGSKDPEVDRPRTCPQRCALMFLLKTCRVAMDAGLLRVCRCEAKFWHASIAKNTVHAVAAAAEEDILVNVDADNIAGPGFVLDVSKRFQRKSGRPVIGVTYKVDGIHGSVGRIAVDRKTFVLLQGYDEDAYPTGAQDVDLWLRLGMLARQRGQRVERRISYSRCISYWRCISESRCTSY